MDIKELLAYCDHTLLRVDCTEAEIRKLCDQSGDKLIAVSAFRPVTFPAQSAMSAIK